MYRLLISIDLNVYTKLYKHMVYILKMYTYIYIYILTARYKYRYSCMLVISSFKTHGWGKKTRAFSMFLHLLRAPKDHIYLYLSYLSLMYVGPQFEAEISPCQICQGTTSPALTDTSCPVKGRRVESFRLGGGVDCENRNHVILLTPKTMHFLLQIMQNYKKIPYVWCKPI